MRNPSPSTSPCLKARLWPDAPSPFPLLHTLPSIFRRGSSSFLNKLKLRGNRIGKNGASKLIQYAHWARVGYAAPKDELPPVFVIDLSDNVIDKPMDLAEDLVSKKIKARGTGPRPRQRTHAHTYSCRRGLGIAHEAFQTEGRGHEGRKHRFPPFDRAMLPTPCGCNAEAARVFEYRPLPPLARPASRPLDKERARFLSLPCFLSLPAHLP